MVTGLAQMCYGVLEQVEVCRVTEIKKDSHCPRLVKTADRSGVGQESKAFTGLGPFSASR